MASRPPPSRSTSAITPRTVPPSASTASHACSALLPLVTTSSTTTTRVAGLEASLHALAGAVVLGLLAHRERVHRRPPPATTRARWRTPPGPRPSSARRRRPAPGRRCAAAPAPSAPPAPAPRRAWSWCGSRCSSWLRAPDASTKSPVRNERSSSRARRRSRSLMRPPRRRRGGVGSATHSSSVRGRGIRLAELLVQRLDGGHHGDVAAHVAVLAELQELHVRVAVVRRRERPRVRAARRGGVVQRCPRLRVLRNAVPRHVAADGDQSALRRFHRKACESAMFQVPSA